MAVKIMLKKSKNRLNYRVKGHMLSSLNQIKKYLVFLLLFIFLFFYQTNSRALNGTTCSPQNTITILSIDGGGIYGLIPLAILDYIEKNSNTHIAELFDLVIGTSTGAIIAAGLSLPNKNNEPAYSAQEITKKYLDFANACFDAPWYHKITSLGGFISPYYTVKSRNEVFKEIFKDIKLSQAVTNLITTAFNLNANYAIHANSFYAKKNSKKDFYLYDLIAGGTSYPALFPAHQFYNPFNKKEYTLVDGAVYAQDPAIIGLLSASSQHPNQCYFIVSLGTGLMAPYSDSPNKLKDAGIWEWIFPLVASISNGMQTNNYLLLSQLNKNLPSLTGYYRIEPILMHVDFWSEISDKVLVQINGIGHRLMNQRKQDIDTIITRLLAIKQAKQHNKKKISLRLVHTHINHPP